MIRRELSGSPGELSEFNLPTLEQATAKNYCSRELTEGAKTVPYEAVAIAPILILNAGLGAYQEGEAEEARPASRRSPRRQYGRL